MRVLHTADWHIGHRLHDHERHAEHQLFLDWLLDTIETQRVDLLIVAGDIFDNGYPSHEALKQYYEFLRGLVQTQCRNTVIVGGNHDYPGTLNAPRDILAFLNIKVVGKASRHLPDQVIHITNRKNELQAVVCAVPFLRDREIREAVAGESYEQIHERVREGIIRHYHNLSHEIVSFKSMKVPVLATGHLFAQGGEASDKELRDCSEKPIHIGTLGNIAAADFPEAFDYIALGHLHRPQKVNGKDHIRYSGSPISLSFSEFSDVKNVLLLDFEDNILAGITPIEVPKWQKLMRFKGDFAAIEKTLSTFDDAPETRRVWAEIKVQLDHYEPNIVQRIQDMFAGRNIDILKHQVIYTNAKLSLDEQVGTEKSLHELSPEEVFLRKCESEGLPEDQQPEMLHAFRELLAEVEEGLPQPPPKEGALK